LVENSVDHWNDRDTDGDVLANGVFLYKLIAKLGGETIEGGSEVRDDEVSFFLTVLREITIMLHQV
jgi:hypothetical protein